MIASRIVSHGLVNGNVKDGIFNLGGTPFTVYLRPKSATSNVDEVVSVKLYQEDAATPAPLSVYDWSPMYITEMEVPESLTNTYDVFWGSGFYIENEEED